MSSHEMKECSVILIENTHESLDWKGSGDSQWSGSIEKAIVRI
jgi:hypothetical protein